MARDGIIKTAHSARLRLVHGEDCEGCQDIGLEKALRIVALAGWRIVRFADSYNGYPAPMYDPDGDPVLADEWTPDAAGVAAGPQATKTAYEGTLAVHVPDEAEPYPFLRLDGGQGDVVFMPGTRLSVQVVAVPTDHEDQPDG